MHRSDGNPILRRVLIALLGLILLGFFIAALANRVPSSLVFAANAPEPSALWAWGDNNFCLTRLVGYSGDNEAAR